MFRIDFLQPATDNRTAVGRILYPACIKTASATADTHLVRGTWLTNC